MRLAKCILPDSTSVAANLHLGDGRLVVWLYDKERRQHAIGAKDQNLQSRLDPSDKKRSEETQTLRAGCSKAEPKFSPRRRPLPGGAGRPKFNQLEMMVTTFTYKPSFGEDRCTQFRVIVLTDPQTQPQTHTQTGPITIHCAAASAQCKSSSYTTKRTRIMMLQ